MCLGPNIERSRIYGSCMSNKHDIKLFASLFGQVLSSMLASFSTLFPQILTASHGQGLSPSSQTPASQTRYSALPQVSRIGFIARGSANAFPCQRRRLANTCRSLSGSAHSPPHLLRASNQIVGFVFYAQALASHLLCRSGNPTFGPLFASSPIESLFPAAVTHLRSIFVTQLLSDPISSPGGGRV